MLVTTQSTPNAIAALWRIVRNVFRYQPVFADADVSISRRNRCFVCPHLRTDVHGIEQCAKCTCVVGLKVLVRTEQCPVGVWGQQTRFSTGL